MAPPGHDVTTADLVRDDGECWQMVRYPVRFLVFDTFEMPMILGMPMIAAMTGGFSSLRGRPGIIALYDELILLDGQLIDGKKWQLSVRMLRTVAPSALVVSCLEVGQ